MFSVRKDFFFHMLEASSLFSQHEPLCVLECGVKWDMSKMGIFGWRQACLRCAVWRVSSPMIGMLYKSSYCNKFLILNTNPSNQPTVGYGRAEPLLTHDPDLSKPTDIGCGFGGLALRYPGVTYDNP